MLSSRLRSRFQPSDPAAVRARFARIKERALARAEQALGEIKPLAHTAKRTALPSPLRQKRRS